MTSRADTDTPTTDAPGTDLTAPNTAPSGLTEAMARFCEAYVSCGSGNAAEAAREAGYPENSARQTGYRLLRHDGCRDYIQSLTQEAMQAVAPIALRTMTRLCVSARSEFVQAQAAQALLDRSGFRPPDSRSRTVSGAVTITIDLGEG